MLTIKERLAILETQIKGLQRTQWILITAVLAQLGIEVNTLVFATLA